MELIFLGMAIGHWFERQAVVAYRRVAILGVLFLMLFLCFRRLDGFGNIRPMPGEGWMDFLSLVKYPPSLTFTLFTMGINLLLLWVFSRLPERWR